MFQLPIPLSSIPAPANMELISSTLPTSHVPMYPLNPAFFLNMLVMILAERVSQNRSELHIRSELKASSNSAEQA